MQSYAHPQTTRLFFQHALACAAFALVCACKAKTASDPSGWRAQAKNGTQTYVELGIVAEKDGSHSACFYENTLTEGEMSRIALDLELSGSARSDNETFALHQAAGMSPLFETRVSADALADALAGPQWRQSAPGAPTTSGAQGTSTSNGTPIEMALTGTNETNPQSVKFAFQKFHIGLQTFVLQYANVVQVSEDLGPTPPTNPVWAIGGIAMGIASRVVGPMAKEAGKSLAANLSVKAVGFGLDGEKPTAERAELDDGLACRMMKARAANASRTGLSDADLPEESVTFRKIFREAAAQAHAKRDAGAKPLGSCPRRFPLVMPSACVK